MNSGTDASQFAKHSGKFQPAAGRFGVPARSKFLICLVQPIWHKSCVYAPVLRSIAVNSPANISILAGDWSALNEGNSASAGWAPISHVLIVSNDAECAASCSELVESLGYFCDLASDALGALQSIASDTGIGIVLVDLKLDQLDGLFLLKEISERFAPARPMVTVAVGEELSVEVMRSGASDFLAKPVAVDDLSYSLRRAASRWTTLAQQFRLNAANQFGVGMVPGIGTLSKAQTEPSSLDLQDLGQKIIKSRQNRLKFIDASLLNEATWGILLDLTVAALKGERVATSSACAATQAPLSTALRHVNQLIVAGWIKRVGDTKDRRRTFLELRPHAFDLMVKFLRLTWELHQQKPVAGKGAERRRLSN